MFKTSGQSMSYGTNIAVVFMPGSARNEQWQMPGSATARTSPDYIRRLQMLYVFRDDVAVSEFLEANPFLVSVLVDAFVVIGEYFPNTPLVINTFVDQENSADVQLVLTITTDVPVEEALAALDKFDNDWWLDAMPLARGKLIITLGST